MPAPTERQPLPIVVMLSPRLLLPSSLSSALRSIGVEREARYACRLLSKGARNREMRLTKRLMPALREMPT